MKHFIQNNLNLNDLFFNIKCDFIECKNYKSKHKARDKSALAKKIVMDFLELVIEDMVDNDVSFKFPVYAGAVMYVSESPERIKNFRNKIRTTDELFSADFKQYNVFMDFFQKHNRRRYYVSVPKKYYDKLKKNTINGKKYRSNYYW